ncbi:response regulator transcription factor [Sulfurospirillum barnesii]|uniref:Response regulator with CheY-like receiver domain and winged-helix DNA-binding domain n=1 Tax=Sulfurospirillum barnesii (strain ATCC 700032 / DSM 10660 / SES-3) TaxID=760154 RepID=I3XZQ6_SULBS|nr:response regulator transcription factor [Sulfurospirillum barnesii]AFL69430.1 response regulator with CheY-like receiver domain and winged-helix DNA-binding domain [Sulfurospirillum barnesii SES-3]
MKILVVEDDEKIASFLKQGLEEERFSVDGCDNGEDALYLAQMNPYDIIILDLMIHGMQGDAVCQKLREQKLTTPIIVLSAKSTINDKVGLLHLGADDYLTKPFSFEELLARIHVQLRKTNDKEPLLKVADLELNPLTKNVTRAQEPISLTAKEYILLEYLMRHKGAIIEEHILAEQLFSQEQSINSNIVSVYMYRLRTKVDKNHPQKLIKTIRNLGYTLNENAL